MTLPSKFETLIYKKDQSVLTIMLNRPERLNAFSQQMFHDVTLAVENAATDPDIRVIIFKGSGRAFSSGADLRDLSEGKTASTEDAIIQYMKEAQGAFNKVEALPKPTIAVINGPAVGAGFQLTLTCDFRIAVKGIKMGLSDVKIGIIPGLGATTRLPKLIGIAKSKEMIMYGNLITSEEANVLGLLNRLVEPDALDDSVEDFTEGLIERAPLAVSTAKELINTGADPDRVAAAQARLLKTADAKEGIASFLEKRKPHFTGS